jgi:UPF0755 protein
VLLFVFAATLGYNWLRPLHPGEDIFTLGSGATVRGFARELVAADVIGNTWSLALLARVRGQHRSIKAGDYAFPDGISQWGILDQLVAGKTVSFPLVLIEGWNFREFRAALNTAKYLAHDTKELSDAEIMVRLGQPGLHPEGRFFPDTYSYNKGTSDLVILRQAFETMATRLDVAWAGRADGLPYRTIGEGLVMASIVEKETGAREERAEIAGVFVNRLRKRMLLQTDPTVIYGLGSNFDGNLRKRDLLRDGPYNTYTRRGLPPTPIAMPGAESLHAAMHPADTDNLYFVARGDGSHEFSATLEQHARAVRRFQLGQAPASPANQDD